MKLRIGSAVLGVSDLDRAVAFYRDVLGFPLVRTIPEQSYGQFDAGGVALKLVGGHPTTSALYSVLEIQVDDVEAAYAELSAKGVAFPMPPAEQPWGGWLAQMRDPDGDLFHLEPAG